MAAPHRDLALRDGDGLPSCIGGGARTGVGTGVGRASEQDDTGAALRAVGFYRGRHSYIDDVWGRYAALEAGWRGVLAGANME